ncbi:hypothetical protein NAP1_05125 [Erythrobacter sp. NAP1]|uniref:hypothetical protein n=1 Tax=Erythrobacter sp. NAP1 TaxID=237727 RepID=UPI0000686B2F|nr:hypothetical protein [Erythrobacter sp. NAP1]EAQ30131.1 hypothetical protein NAP1_05125 [Erythrobacter sp. NAP1]
MNKANIFMAAGWTGLVSLLAVIALSLTGASDALATFTSSVTVACCWMMLFTRNADEYTRGLWTSAASLAFAALLLLVFGLPALEGAYDGMTAGERRQDFEPIMAVGLAIVAFYIGLFWKRLRGGV